MHSFPLPISMPEFTISLLWHPRMEADCVLKLLRAAIRPLGTWLAWVAASRKWLF